MDIHLRRAMTNHNLHNSQRLLMHSLFGMNGKRVRLDKSIRIELLDATTQGHHHHLAKLKAKRQSLFSGINSIELIEEQEIPNTDKSTSIELSVDNLAERHLSTFYGIVTVGDQEFKMLMDTGSCELWVTSDQCDLFSEEKICAAHSKFDKKKTKTYKEFEGDKIMSVTYLSGEIEGPLAYETVKLGSIVVNDQPFATADTIKVPLLADVKWDGVLGLAYPNKELYDQGVVPVMDSMIERKMLDHNIVSYYVNCDVGGVITFGGIDTSLLADQSQSSSFMEVDVQTEVDAQVGQALNLISDKKGKSKSSRKSKIEDSNNKFMYATVTDKGYWTIDIIDIEIQYGDDEPIKTGVCKDQGESQRCKAIVDTGTYLSYGPESMFLGSELSKVKVESCDGKKDLPSLTFILWAGEGETPARITLHPEDYVLEYRIPNDDAPEGYDCVANKKSEKCHTDCVVGFAPDKQSEWTLGQSFIKTFYLVFDREKDQVGFAKSKFNASMKK